jgi:uncharacterized protein YcfJ
MKHASSIAIALASLSLATPAAAEATLYERPGYSGRSFTATDEVKNLEREGFRDRATSAVIRGRRGDRWELCEERGFRGRCVVLSPGEYASLDAIGLRGAIASAHDIGRAGGQGAEPDSPAPSMAPQPQSRIDLYEDEGYRGRSYSSRVAVEDFRTQGFNDRASSAVVTGERWEVCEDVRFGGRCVVLRQGQYPSLGAMGLNDRISSMRALQAGARVEDHRYSPLPVVARDYRRRDEERLYEAEVTSVRAVLEEAGEQCWVEPEQVVQEGRGGSNVPGAVLGAVIGGILGHQVGGGTGRDVATGVGAVAGAAIGANSGRGDAQQQVVTTKNVRRCARTPGAAHPAYWDVSYRFRGQEYRVQMTRPPGATVTVNEEGEPRV